MEQVISDSEMLIMKLIWKNGGAITSTELLESLQQQGRGWKRSTISTFITRLCEKGMLASMKQGRTYLYTALLSQREYGSGQAREFVDKLFGGNAKGLVAALIEEGRLCPEDIAELTNYWNEQERSHDE